MTPIVDRRREPRIQAFNLVSAAHFNRWGGLDDLALGRTTDLSHEGLRLELDHSLPVRSRLRLSLALGNSILGLEGRIVSVAEVDTNRFELGVQFTHVTADQYEQLDEYLRLRL